MKKVSTTMALSIRPVILGLFLAGAFVAPAWANCNDAVDSYSEAITEIEYQLNRYARCVSSSAGEDDCNSEFRRLRGAQDDYETAVSSYRDECA